MATGLVIQAKYVHFGMPRHSSPATHTSFLFGFTVTYSFLSSPLQKYFPVPPAVRLQTRLAYPVWPIKKAHRLPTPKDFGPLLSLLALVRLSIHLQVARRECYEGEIICKEG
jgi:hypothetical protein